MHEIATYVSIMSRICGLPADTIPPCYEQEVLDIADKFNELNKLNELKLNLDVLQNNGETTTKNENSSLADAILMYFSSDDKNKNILKVVITETHKTRASLYKEVFIGISLGTMFKIYNVMVKNLKSTECGEDTKPDMDMDMVDFSNDDNMVGGADSLLKTDKKVMVVVKSKGIVKEVPVYKDQKHRKYVRKCFVIYAPLADVQKETNLFLKAKKKKSHKSIN